MVRLIDIEPIETEFAEVCKKANPWQAVAWLMNALDNAPNYELTQDVVAITPNKGRWVRHDSYTDKYGRNMQIVRYQCDCCGKTQAYKTYHCPNCGAKREDR